MTLIIAWCNEILIKKRIWWWHRGVFWKILVYSGCICTLHFAGYFPSKIQRKYTPFEKFNFTGIYISVLFLQKVKFFRTFSSIYTFEKRFVNSVLHEIFLQSSIFAKGRAVFTCNFIRRFSFKNTQNISWKKLCCKTAKTSLTKENFKKKLLFARKMLFCIFKGNSPMKLYETDFLWKEAAASIV